MAAHGGTGVDIVYLKAYQAFENNSEEENLKNLPSKVEEKEVDLWVQAEDVTFTFNQTYYSLLKGS